MQASGWSCLRLCLEAVSRVSLDFNSQLFFCEIIYFWINCLAIPGKQIWPRWSSTRLVLLLSWMSPGIEQSCNLIYEMKQAKCSSTKAVSVINPDGFPTLFTCCYAKSGAGFAMPLAAFPLQREFGIRSAQLCTPRPRGPAPQKGWGGHQGGWGKETLLGSYCSATLF